MIRVTVTNVAQGPAEIGCYQEVVVEPQYVLPKENQVTVLATVDGIQIQVWELTGCQPIIGERKLTWADLENLVLGVGHE